MQYESCEVVISLWSSSNKDSAKVESFYIISFYSPKTSGKQVKLNIRLFAMSLHIQHYRRIGWHLLSSMPLSLMFPPLRLGRCPML